MELKEFTSGSAAKRFIVGFGAGRATIIADLVIRDASGKPIARKNIKTNGQLAS